jgi:copper chaperone CopZ
MKKEQEVDKVVLNVGGMTCTACSSTIEAVVGSVEGVLEISVNLALEKATIKYDSNKTGVRSLISEIEGVCAQHQFSTNLIAGIHILTRNSRGGHNYSTERRRTREDETDPFSLVWNCLTTFSSLSLVVNICLMVVMALQHEGGISLSL